MTAAAPAPVAPALVGRPVRQGRHVARLCRTCSAPMAGQADSCWRCGAAWVSEPEPEAAQPR